MGDAREADLRAAGADEVAEGVCLAEELAILVPLPAQLPSSPHVRSVYTKDGVVWREEQAGKYPEIERIAKVGFDAARRR